MQAVSILVTISPASSTSSALTTISSAKQKLMNFRPTNADTTLVVFNYIAHDSLLEDIKEGWGEYAFIVEPQ